MKRIIKTLAIVFTLAPAVAAPVDGSTIRVVDGDTVAVPCTLYTGCIQRLRFALTDAPEMGRAACEEERLTARRARDRLAAMLQGRPINIVYLGKDDRYGRPLVVLITPEGIPEIMLITEGLSDIYSPRRRSIEQHRAKWCPLQ
jgi:micrococcal nuclease